MRDRGPGCAPDAAGSLRTPGKPGSSTRHVGLSNILDRELRWGEPVEGPHREVVGAAVVDRKLLCEIVQRIECVAGIEAFLVLTVAALHLTVVPRGIRANQLMPDAQLSSRPLKQRAAFFFGPFPSRRTGPLSGCFVPSIHSIAVLFPAPFAPSSPNAVPLFAESSR